MRRPDPQLTAFNLLVVYGTVSILEHWGKQPEMKNEEKYRSDCDAVDSR
jgi:hypothetical protein